MSELFCLDQNLSSFRPCLVRRLLAKLLYRPPIAHVCSTMRRCLHEYYSCL
jgi:hypothetical protein